MTRRPRPNESATRPRKTSYALIDQVRSVDKGRVRRAYGRITTQEMAAIDEGLALFLGL